MNQQYKSFMGQFAAAKQEAQQLREMMKESARVATLTFPTSKNLGQVATETMKKKS